MLVDRAVRLHVTLALLFVGAAFYGSPRTPEALELNVTPRRGFGPAPIRVIVRIPSNETNRRLTLVIDGPNYWSGSDIELNEGERIVERAFCLERRNGDCVRGIPDGRYEIIAVLVRAGGKNLRATETVCLVGPTETCE